MSKNILYDFDTLALGGGFFLHWGKLYFFSQEELRDIQIICLENLKKFCFDNNVKPNKVNNLICPKP